MNEEEGDDVKSSWPLCPGLHTCYNGQDYGSLLCEGIEEFAKGYGCKYTSVYGRRGWLRRLEKFGYKQPYTLLMKEI